MLSIKALILAITVNDRLSAAALNKVLKFLGERLGERLFPKLLRTLKLFSVTRAK